MTEGRILADANDPPLHVRVAGALGCKWRLVLWVGSQPRWTCECNPGVPHNYDEDNGRDGMLLEYDTDWSATGPLIEKYRILLITPPSYGDWIARVHGYDENRTGATPLIAVCELILALKAAGKLEP